MNPKIEMNNEWYECNFQYPFKEPPVFTSGPLGTSRWLPPKYNAKLVSNYLFPIGRYTIVINGKQLIFEAERPIVDGILGNVF